jgi:hypothetical protein
MKRFEQKFAEALPIGHPEEDEGSSLCLNVPLATLHRHKPIDGREGLDKLGNAFIDEGIHLDLCLSMDGHAYDTVE